MSNKIKFILNTSVDYFSLNENAAYDDLPIKEFLESDELTLLAAINHGDKVIFAHTISEDENCLVFYKIPQIGRGTSHTINGKLSAAVSSSTTTTTAPTSSVNDVMPLGILTLEGGLAKSIYNSFSRVFSPHVAKKIQYPADLEILIETLHSSLSTTLGLPQSSVHSVQHEIHFWNEKSRNSSAKADKETANAFAVAIDKLNQLLRNVASLSSLEEFIDAVHTILDEIWRLPQNYPQTRMTDLLDIISLNILEFCSDRLYELEDIWDIRSLAALQTLTDITEVVDAWLQVCDSLTRLFWPNYSRHAWIGEPHLPKNARAFLDRLNDVQNVRNVYKEIVCLFNEINQIDKSHRQIFLPFQEINLFDVSTIGAKKWQHAWQRYIAILEPINEKVALILKSKLSKHLDEPCEIVQIFLKYDAVVKSPEIIELLAAEREHFLHSLLRLMKQLKDQLMEPRRYPEDLDISNACWETKTLKMFQIELNQIEKVMHLVRDIDGYDVVRKSLTDLKEETNKWIESNFEAWREQSLTSIMRGELTLKDDKPVVEFERDGRQLMLVTFKPTLVTFCSDVHEFEDMGFRIPIDLRQTAMNAIKFMGHARKLQQIANFHNTIGDRMIPCVRPIMLKNALELSNLVRSESVAWNDEESVERYVSTLQVSVNNLSRDNSILTEYHEKAKCITMKLMSTDLLRQNEQWREEMKSLRNVVTQLETKGYTNLQAFKIHWDHQLYKVLEYQYLIGLSDLSHRLPDIHIDIVFRQQEIQFRPTMEEIRSTYYTQLRRFIERPLSFKGLSDQSGNIFKAMVDINRERFGVLYEKGESLFNRLYDFQDAWRPFVILGCVNLEDLCDVYLKTRDDWDKNFKACKAFSQQIAKIPSDETYIDCFVINTSPIRSDIEFISRKYWEVLSYSLRSSILRDITTLQDFLNTSLQVLQTVPALEESYIEEAGEKCQRIIAEMPAMTEVLKSVEAKDSCLAGWCRERVSALNGILNQWEQLQPLIDNHSAALKIQIDAVKNQVEFQIASLKDEMEKFQIRWEATIAELENNEETKLDVFKERQNSWQSIVEKKTKLERSCAKYLLEFSSEIEELFGRMASDIENQGQQWKEYEQFLSEYDVVSREEWSVYRRRPYILSDFLSKWSASSKIQTNDAAKRIARTIDMLQSAMPTLQTLQSDGLTEKHWASIFHLMRLPYKSYHDIVLKDVLADVESLNRNAVEIQQLVRKAASEQVVRQALTELDQWGIQAELKTFSHIDSGGNAITVIKDFQEVLNKVGDNQCLLQSAKNSAAFESYSDQAEIWESRLASIDHILTSLSQIQRKWIYLEPIFGTENLLAEGAMFKQINKDFRYIMREIGNDTRVLSLVKIHGVTSIIESLENQLNRCQSTLTTFINTKRNAFPRFYFLSNDDLLELLGQSSKEHIIQKHIKKLFPGIHRLQFEATTKAAHNIAAVCSAEGEVIRLLKLVEIAGGVENWLMKLLHEIRATLQDLIVSCCQYDQFTLDNIEKYPEQILCLAKGIQFTRLTEKSIGSMNLQAHLKSIKGDIEYLTTSVPATVDNLTKSKVRSLLMDLVHHATIVQQLIDENVTTPQDWSWLQQMKFYLIGASKAVTVKMVFAEFDYSFEYLGNANRLVDTKLTHNCYLTLTQAMRLGLGGNPFGPAGTGKTECVKSLGAMLGRLVLVFNCSENVDVTAIGLILSGLARCGAWGCFDEFNRLQEATLSVLSMLIQPIQSAIQQKSDTVTIFEDPIPLNLHCGIFVTLNPAGEEYGGRQTLPSNLQALFRPIVMQQPEPKEIARVILFVEGFKNAEIIGGRMVELFSMAKKMLSPQRHYEWGLRELKTVLLACGRFLRECTTSGDAPDSSENEMRLAVSALRLNTMSKLTANDCKLFDMLVEFVFAGTSIDEQHNDDLKSFVEQAFAQLNLQYNDQQMEKCLQLFEQLQKRMGVVVLGPPGCGKSTIIAVLKQAILNSGRLVKSHTIAPKSMNRVQLLGRLDPDTRQWNDGVLTATAVQVNDEPADVTSWIVCDGDVDPDWIEALNSVLDDNKLLTLPSGWRIQFGDNVNFIFETHDLLHASPATISRMGIVNLSSTDLALSTVYDAWIVKQSSPDAFATLVKDYLAKALDWAERKSIDLSKIGVVSNVLKYTNGTSNKTEFCVRLIYSFGYALNGSQQNEFAAKVFEWADVYVPSDKEAKYCYYNEHRNAVDVYESDGIVEIDALDNIANRLIKTVKIKTYLNILRTYLLHEIPFTMIGPSGSGTSLLVNNVVGELAGYELVTINCSSQLTTSYVLHQIKQNSLVISGNRGGREYKPRFNRIVLFFKNIDLCSTDEWGTCEIIELILQLIRRNGFYSDTLEWISVTGCDICCSMSDVPKQRLSPRYMSIAQNFHTEFPSDIELHLIIKNQFWPICSRFKYTASRKQIDQIVDALIAIYSNIKSTFTRDQRNHYVFTPKMLSRLVEGLKYYPENCFQQAFFSEAKCIFGNRLIHDEHRGEFERILDTCCRRLFDVDQTDYYFVPSSQSSHLSYTNEFDWAEQVKRAVTVCSTEDLCLDSVVVHDGILQTTADVCRVISRPQSHLLIVGLTGSGKLECIHIACTYLNIKLLTITPLKNYSVDDFFTDLKLAMQSAALEEQQVVFVVNHTWIAYLPEIMNPIEAILEGSEIPNLFGDDLESLAKPLKNAAQQDGYQDSLASFFWMRVKRRLHIVIALESECSASEELFTTYPALYKSVEIIWMSNGADYRSEQTAKAMVASTDQSTTVPAPRYLAVFEVDGVGWKASPHRFKHLMLGYCHLYKDMYSAIQKQQETLQAGVDKLSSAHEVVRTLKEDAQQQEVALAEKRELANNALEMIATTMKSATNQKSDLLELKNKAQENSKLLMQRKEAVELELREVEPILKEAIAAVGQIKNEALSEIRSLRAPPDIIRDILEGVLRLMGTRDTSWNSMKSFLSKRGVKEDIRSMDPSRISVDSCNAVEKLLASKSESFDVRNAKRASAAAAPLATWVIANVKYCKVIQSIKPLEQEQEMLQKSLKDSENNMRLLKSGLDDVDARVKELSGQLNVYTQEAAVLELKLESARNTLKSSEVLVTKLSAEYGNWQRQLVDINAGISEIDLDAFFVAFYISHLSHMTYERRQSIVQAVLAHLKLSDVSCEKISQILLTDQDRIIWENMGLTADVQSMENASLLTKILNISFGAAPIPMLNDPTKCAIAWLTKYLQSKELAHDVTTQHSDRFAYTLELAVRFGKILIVEDCNEIEPPLLGIVTGHIHSRFNKKYLQVGNKLVDFNEHFKLILCSRGTLASSGSGIIDAFVTIVPFTTTVAGLTDQLMTKSIQVKQPELETKRIALLQRESELLKKRQELQEKLLLELSASQGDILKNQKLLDTLNEVKTSSSSIDVALQESSEVKKKLLLEYDQYKSICSRAANLYIGINQVYSLPVHVFSSLYVKSINNGKDFDQRRTYEQIVKFTYNMLSRSLSKTDHFTLALHILKEAYPELVPQKEWESFLSNFVLVEDAREHTVPAWIKKSITSKVIALKLNHPEFYATLQLDDENLWRHFTSGGNVVDVPVNVSEFHRILVTQIFRPDLLVLTMTKSLSKVLGTSVPCESKPSIQQLVDETKEDEPIVFITTGETDPSKEIQEFASTKFGKSSKYVEVAIGKGQESQVTQQIRRAASQSDWICVKNVQLVPHWLKSLNEELQTLSLGNGFRLWLVCDSTKSFPASLLSKCNKVLYEAPNSIKSKVQRLIQQWRTMLERKRDAKLLKVYIVLFIFNSVLQERRAYVPQGWSASYEFSDADLKTAIDIIGWMEKSLSFKMEWTVLKELYRLIAYGGRISNAQDQQILKANLDEFFSDKTLANTWSPLEFRLTIPLSYNVQDYLNALQSLADTDGPEQFGLSSVTILIKDTIMCRNILKQLRHSELSVEGVANFDKRLKPILGLWRKLNQNSSLIHQDDATAAMSPVADATDPWLSFIVSEMLMAKKLFKTIHETLTVMHAATKDISLLTKDDVALMMVICENQVPIKWRQIWSGPRSIVEYMKSVVSRGFEAEKRYEAGSGGNSVFCAEIDLAKVYNVESFLAALKLKNARELQSSTCDLVLVTSLAGTMNNPQTTKASVVSLVVDGAAWQDNKIVQNMPESSSSSTIKNFSITYGIGTTVRSKQIADIPLYSNATRSSLICTLQVCTASTIESVILAGVALIVPD